MRARIYFASAMVCIFLALFFSEAKAGNCKFFNPVHSEKKFSDSLLGGMHAVGYGALPGVDGVGYMYPMFRGTLAAIGEESNPSGFQTTFVRIEGTDECKGWVMDVFHLAFAKDLESKLGQPVDENTYLGVDSMRGIDPMYQAHWHLSVGYRSQNPGNGILVNDAVGPVYWIDPTSFELEKTQGQHSPDVLNWRLFAIIAGIVLLVAVFGFVIAKPARAWELAWVYGNILVEGIAKVWKSGSSSKEFLKNKHHALLRDKKIMLAGAMSGIMLALPVCCLAGIVSFFSEPVVASQSFKSPLFSFGDYKDARAIILSGAMLEKGCDPGLIYALWSTETKIVDCSPYKNRSGQNSCRSEAGAEGPLQFMPGTWQMYANPSWDVWDLKDSTRAACRMAKKLDMFSQSTRDAFSTRASGMDGGPAWNPGIIGYSQMQKVWDIWKNYP